MSSSSEGKPSPRSPEVPLGSSIRISTSSAGLVLYERAELASSFQTQDPFVVKVGSKTIDLGRVVNITAKPLSEWTVESGVYRNYAGSVMGLGANNLLIRVECLNSDRSNALYFIQVYE